MTRINVVPVADLTDQHLMAEYRELPMVHASARRSSKHTTSTTYTLNKGHVMFFYNKRSFLLNRWLELIEELDRRGFNIDPGSRVADWRVFDKFPQVEWTPTKQDMIVNQERIDIRISQRPSWYRFHGKPLNDII